VDISTMTTRQRPIIPEPPNRQPSDTTNQPEPREPNELAIHGGAVGIQEPGPVTLTHNESEKEMLERAQRGRFRRIF
jgi:hypothetical protein